MFLRIKNDWINRKIIKKFSLNANEDKVNPSITIILYGESGNILHYSTFKCAVINTEEYIIFLATELGDFILNEEKFEFGSSDPVECFENINTKALKGCVGYLNEEEKRRKS
jgi:hypothetical protein